MRTIKSERLKKLEAELHDLEQWLKLGLVPKKEIEKHKEEIELIREKINEELERLQILRESGEADDYVAPKRSATRSGYTEMPSLPDIDVSESQAGYDNDSDDSNHETSDKTASDDDDDDSDDSFVEEESYFSDRNRWKRGSSGIIDPDANEW